MKDKEQIFLNSFIFFVFVFVLSFNIIIFNTPQWLDLARSFLSGKLHFLSAPYNLTDSTFFNGQYYWPFGPLPAILIMPFVWLGDFLGSPLSQGQLQFPLTLLIFWLAIRIAKKVGYTENDSMWWALAFTFASPLVWIVVSPGWGYFPYEFAVLFSLLAVYEYLGKRRWPRIGFLTALVFLTRPTAGLIALFFILRIVFEKKSERQKNLIFFLIPLVIAVLLFGGYNYARFGSPLEQGYAFQTLTREPLSVARSYGLLSPTHIPGNLYHLLLAAPQPVFRDGVSHVLSFPYIKADPWGMSFLFVSPYLILLFFLSYRDQESRHILFVSFLILCTALLYYGIGIVQIGYRYALDFFPLVYLLLLKNYPKRFSWSLSASLKTLIVLSAILDLFFCFSIFL